MNGRVLISLEDITLSFGGKPLFEGLNLHVCEGDKICLVGRNGSGKTTLMKLMMQELELDAGKRFALPGITIGYLAQNVPFEQHQTVRCFVLSGLMQENQTEDKLYLADMVIAPLSLDADATMGTLSGGQLRRAALARALVAAPDLLLLDEPTNHLDLGGIEWLEQYLAAYKGAVVCVSHDRAFLANISRKVFWIDRGAIRYCPVGYAEFDDWAEKMLEQEARALQNLQKKFLAEVDWTQGGVSARRKRNIRRLNELRRLREKLRSDKDAYKQRLRKIEADPLVPTPGSKIVVEFKGVSKSFHRNGREIPILRDFHMRIIRGDRIGILGKNGSGKSTFIKLLIGELQPDAGRIFRGKTVDITYFDQNRTDLDPDNTLWKTLCPDGDYVQFGSPEKPRYLHVCAYLKNFLFDPKAARDKVGTLSGGQQNRLLLARALARPGNVLILDEPTNDLDMDTLDMLQEILSDYKGTLIVVSHDRDFLDRTVTEVLAFEGDAMVEGYLGGYTDYQNEKKKRHAPRKQQQEAQRKETASERKPRSRLTYKLQHELEKLPGKITALEMELQTLKAALADADLYMKDPGRFDEATQRFGEAQQELAAAEARWLELEALRQQN